METNQIINLTANILISIGVAFFMVFVFGRSNQIEKLHFFERWAIKIALSITACGSFFNVLTLSNPPFSELIFNVGLAFVFVWGAFFHYKYFVKHKK